LEVALRKFVAALFTVAISAVGASAADLPVRTYTKAPSIVEVAYNWTGFYVGLNAGYGWGRDTNDLAGIGNNLVSGGGFPASFSLDPKGFIGGAQAGYNFQSGAWVIGIEGDFDYANLTASTDIVRVQGVPRFTHDDTVTEWLATLRARVGYTPVDRLLVFGTGGLAVGSVKNTITATTTVPNNVPACVAANIGVCFGDSASTVRVGWTVGGGLEYALSGSWTVKAEYLYYDLGSIGRTIVEPTDPTDFLVTNTHVRGNIARLGVNYRFGGPVVAKY
jgi:outer membrane immunogenic protein